jgi:hypothetical protein
MITDVFDDFSMIGITRSHDIFLKWFNWINIIGVKVKENEKIDSLKLHLLKHLNEFKSPFIVNIDEWGNSLFNLFLIYKISNNGCVNGSINDFSIDNKEFFLPFNYNDIILILIDIIKKKIIENLDFDDNIYELLNLLIKSSLIVLDSATLYSRLVRHSEKRIGFNVDEKGIITNDNKE